MKFYQLPRPRKEIPLATLLGSSVIGSGLSSVGSGISALIQSNAMKKANEQNVAMQRETNELQYRMMQEQNEWNRQQAIDMFNLEASYNSPIKQMQRLKEAGINPAVAFGQNLATSAGNSNASTPAAVGVPTPQAPHVSPVPSPIAGVSEAITSNIVGLAQAIGSVSNAKRQDAETDRINALLKSEMDRLQAEAEGQRIVNSINEIQKEMNEWKYTLDIQYSERERVATIKNLVSQYELNIAKKETEAADALLKKIQEKLSSKEYEILQEKAPLLIQELREQIELLREKQSTEKAYQNQANASARLSSAQASTVNALRDSQVRLSHADAQTREKEYALFLNTYENMMTQSDIMTDIQRQTLESLGEQLEAARRSNDWGTIRELTGIISQFVSVSFNYSNTNSNSNVRSVSDVTSHSTSNSTVTHVNKKR